MPVEVLAEKFSDFRGMQTRLDEMPADERARIGDVAFTQDSIVITTPQVGAITLRATERTADRVVMQAEGSPVPMSIIVEMTPVGASETEVVGKMNVEIPVMLKALVGPALQKAVDQFGEIFAKLA